MKLSAIQVKFETSKYLALKRYAAKKEVSLEQELEETLNRLYRKLIQVRQIAGINFTAFFITANQNTKLRILFLDKQAV